MYQSESEYIRNSRSLKTIRAMHEERSQIKFI